MMARQAIKYQNTTVEAQKSAHEICGLIQRYGAREFRLRFDANGDLEGVDFLLVDPELGFDKPIPVSLTARVEKIFDILKDAERRARRGASRLKWQERERRIREQAIRIAWRQLKDFVEQSLLAAQTGLFSTAAVFMAHLVTETGQTVAEMFAERAELGERGLRLLAPGESKVTSIDSAVHKKMD